MADEKKQKNIAPPPVEMSLYSIAKSLTKISEQLEDINKREIAKQALDRTYMNKSPGKV